MKLYTYAPGKALKPYVKAIAIQEAEEGRTYKVFPGTGLVMGFQHKGRLSYLEGQNEIPLHRAGVTGLRDNYRLFRNPPGTGTVLVFFREAGAASFFRQPLHELFRESIGLDNFIPQSTLDILEERIGGAGNQAAKIAMVEDFLLSLLRPKAPDPMVFSALSIIHGHKGSIRISELAQKLHMSQSPLEKRFRKAVGTSPKKFASVVRLQHAIQSYSSDKTLTGLAYEAGFFDQAHFIKEFKGFTGETPESYFSIRT